MNRTHRIRSFAILSLAALLLAACEVGLTIPGVGTGATLSSGLYDYRAWSDFSAGPAAWEGVIDLRVRPRGEITGEYLLPGQCRDGRGFRVDCRGFVTGRAFRDGHLRFHFDEGWLRNEGTVRAGRRATGYWSARFIGHADEGTFELVFRRR